ncbi:MAG: gamma-glutamyltransferase [Eubacteriales bacterium]|nr:gamma-glutamyltransferase [Eubacteriales bacterium]
MNRSLSSLKILLISLLIISFFLPLVACKKSSQQKTSSEIDHDEDFDDDYDDGDFEGEDDIANYREMEISSPDELSQGAGSAPQPLESSDPASLPEASEIHYGFAISTSSVLASQAAAEILAAGGNAFDAAVTASFVLGVVEPHASGIGGSGAMLFYLAAEDKYNFLDYRSSSGMSNKQESNVGIPGLVKGLSNAQMLFGKLSWAEALAPAIKLAKDGFIVNNDLERAMRVASQYLAKNPAFLKSNGELVKSGDLLIQEELAETMETLAAEGPESFYTGSLAKKIAAESPLTTDDLANYQSYYRDPIELEFKGQRFVSAPPPYSGITVLQMLKMSSMLELGANQASSPEFLELIERISLVAYDRHKMIVGDPQHIKFKPKRLLSDEYLQKFLDRELRELEPTDSTEQCTTHISIVDQEGNVVSLTNTLTSFWGSASEVGGFYLNNTLSNFSRNKRNYYRPLTRPRSFIAPTIVQAPDGGKFAIGTPGGKLIPKLIYPVFIDYYLYESSLEDAINRQRFFFKGKSALTIEEDQNILPTWPLELSDYYVTHYGFHDYFGSIAVAGYHPDGTPFAISDFRRQGLAIAKSGE